MCCEKSPTGEHIRTYPKDDKEGICSYCGDTKIFPTYMECDNKYPTIKHKSF